ncbi:histidinol phosphate phosphatase domain-containing protein [Candidatus Omnitrophota bacterium]
MIDLHTHSWLSDGAVLPCELARRAEAKGYRAIGITDHVDASNIEFICNAIIKACKDINKNWKIKAIPGVEITHMPIALIKGAIKFARSKGIKLVVVHGESLVEPVMPGTNKEAIISGADILAHPGLISLEDAKLASAKGVHLEITSRAGHSLSNGHVAKMAGMAGAKLVIDTDTHQPGDLITKQFAKNILLAAGLNQKEAKEVFVNSERLACRLLDIKKLI